MIVRGEMTAIIYILLTVLNLLLVTKRVITFIVIFNKIKLNLNSYFRKLF